MLYEVRLLSPSSPCASSDGTSSAHSGYCSRGSRPSSRSCLYGASCGEHAGRNHDLPPTDVVTRPLGRDGPLVSRVGLGLAALGRPGYQNVGHGADIGPDASIDALRRRTHAVLDAAWASGVRYVDAARTYGRAEEFLASWPASRGMAPGVLTVGSKWGYRYTADWRTQATVHEVKDHSLAALRGQLAESRHHLGQYLKLYQ